MDNVQVVMIAGNSFLLAAVLFMAVRLVRSSSKYNFAIGDFDKQTFYKRRILKTIVGMVLLGLTAATFNIILAPF